MEIVELRQILRKSESVAKRMNDDWQTINVPSNEQKWKIRQRETERKKEWSQYHRWKSTMKKRTILKRKKKKTIQSIFAAIANGKRKYIEVVQSSVAYTYTIHKWREKNRHSKTVKEQTKNTMNKKSVSQRRSTYMVTKLAKFNSYRKFIFQYVSLSFLPLSGCESENIESNMIMKW